MLCCLNVKKSNFVILRRKGRKISHQVKIKLIDYNCSTYCSTYLDQKEYVKHLEVLIDN